MARNAVRMGWVSIIWRASSIMAKSPVDLLMRKTRSPDAAACRAKLLHHSLDELGCCRGRVGAFVLEVHRLPLEGTHLMEWLDLDPFDIFHRGDKFGDAFDIRRVIGLARYQRETHPGRLAH